ncbi:MAG: hypothetical protein WAT89_07275 [Candidatus Kapaibacterium sp.]|jgi:hypothetical protein
MLRTTLRSRVRLAKLNSFNQISQDEKIQIEKPKPTVYTNPLNDLIDDSTFNMLFENDLIDSIQLRNYQIRKKYYSLKPMLGSSNAIESLQELYPYLQYDTIRKIIYKAA